MIIWGSTAKTNTTSEGSFHCPECNDKKNYEFKEVKKYFTLYFIPTFSTEDLGQYVECQSCKSTFKESVLENDPKKREEESRAIYLSSTLDVMVSMAMADGKVDETELKDIAKYFKKITDADLSKEMILKRVKKIEDENLSTEAIAKSMSPYLNNYGKETTLRAAILVAKADGKVVKKENQMLHNLSTYLSIPKAYANGIFQEEMVEKIC